MQCEILQNQSIARGIYRMRLAAPGLYCQPGQFVHLSTPPTSQGTLLRRPISIHDYDAEAGILTLCYALVGRGTRALSELSAGQTLDVLGPLGNGFCLPDAGRVLLIGGGLGVAPLMLLSRAAQAGGLQAEVLAGFQSAEQAFSLDALARCAAVHVATEDGSMGTHGRVTDLLNALPAAAYTGVYLCGPRPMVRALSPLLEARALAGRTQVSMEERMGCGIGACLVCNCAVKKPNGDTGYKRVCADGPVFELREVQL